MPLLGFAEAGSGGYFDDRGCPAGEGWDKVAFPAVNDRHAYALEMSGQSMEPAYRDGDIIVVSPAAPVRRGDRVVVRTRGGEVMAKELKRKTARTIELKSLNASTPTACWKRKMCCGSRGSCGSVNRRGHGRACQRAVDHADRVADAVSGDEGAEARPAFLAEQHLIEHVEPVERDAGLAILGFFLLIEKRLTPADFVDHVLNALRIGVIRQLRQRVAQIG